VETFTPLVEASSPTIIENYEPEPVLVAVGDEEKKRYGSGKALEDPPAFPSAEEVDAVLEWIDLEIDTVGVPASDRSVWGPFSETPEGQKLIALGEERLNDPIPVLNEEMWLLFQETGDRRTYQDAFSERMNRLADLAVAEALEYQGRFIPAIEENIREILQQGAWSVPAHGKGLEVFQGQKIIVDLAASQLAWSLATVDYWLSSELEPNLRTQIKAELERRVLDPYLEAVRSGQPYWWMMRPNNWMAVCVGGVTGAALTIEPDPRVRAEFILIAQTILGRYIDGFTSEGISDEGISYWSFGFSHFLYASEAIRRATNGAVDLLQDEHVMAVSQSPRNLEIGGNVYGAFGDQSIRAKADLRISDFAAMRYGVESVDTEPFSGVNGGRRHPLSPQLYSLIVFGFGADAPPVEGFSIPEGDRESHAYRSWFPESELYIFRPGSQRDDGLGLALRIGNNGESHNHNDIGSFVVEKNGRPILIDPGMERYTKDSFSEKRYDISLNNSFGHPVPVVGNRLQKTGPSAVGEVIATTHSEEEDVVEIDLTRAYRTPGLINLRREVRYTRPVADQLSSIVVRDEVEFRSPQNFSTALITRGEITIREDGIVEFNVGGTKVYARIRTGGVPIAFDQRPVTGFTTPASRGIKRLGIYLAEPVQEGFLEITITSSLPQTSERTLNP
tara:strand:+ start:62266 stop:64290 length:2025 start_codon:yes stop_codon:yes gene_type:complete